MMKTKNPLKKQPNVKPPRASGGIGLSWKRNFESTEILETSFFRLYLLIHVIRDRSQTLVRGAWCKKGALKIFDPWLVRGGAWKKITTDFPLKIEFTCFSMGLTRNFHGKKGALKFFLRSESGPRKIFAINIFCIRPPLTSVCERSLKICC